MDKVQLYDTVLLGGEKTWEEVENLPASNITKDANDNEKLNGLLLYGYETKFTKKPNENGEVYAEDCMDEFIERYFVKHELNMPVDIQHRQDIDHLAGRVLYMERNSVGFYFVAYIPKTFKNYEEVRDLLANKILQGFSKMGWATDYEYMYKKDGTFDYVFVRKFELLSVSLVATPANAIPFEKAKEVKNSFRFNIVEREKKSEEEDEWGGMLN